MNLLVVVLAFLAVPIRAWLINTMTDEIVPGATTKMWLECRRDSATYGQHRMTIINIAISKYTAAGSKTILAQIDESNNIHTLSREASFTVTGDVLNDTSKFLRLTWSEVDVEDAGRYGCEVGGFDVLGNTVSFGLKPKDVRVKTVTMADVKQLIKEIKNEYDVTHNRLKLEMERKINRIDSEIENNTHIQSEMEKKHNRLQSEMEKKHNHLQSEMEKKFNSEVANLTNLMNGCQCQPPTEPPTSPATTLPTTTPPVVTTTLPTTTPPVVTTTLPTTTPQTDDDRWPIGRHSMVGPKFPCPASHSSDVRGKKCFDYSDYRIVIASTNQTVCFCDLNVRKSSRATWPRGSYCLKAFVGCPTSFTWQRFAHPLYSSYVYYCCRSDGSSSNEISLPNQSPFYLYTDESNVCQQVKGMTVTQTYRAYKAKGTYRFPGGKESVVVNSPRLCHYQPV